MGRHCFEIIRKYPYHTGLIAYNEHLSLPVLRKLAKNRSEVIRSCIAQRDTLDHELFEKLSRDRKIAVRSCIAYNRKTPLTILKKMYPDAGRYANNPIDVYRHDLIFAVFMLALFSVVLILFILLKRTTFLMDFALSITGLSGIYCFSVILHTLLTVIYVNLMDNQTLNIVRIYGFAFCFIIIPLMFFSFVSYYHSSKCILFLELIN